MSKRILDIALSAALAAGAVWIVAPRAVSAGGSLLGAGDGGTIFEPIAWTTEQGRAGNANVQRAVIKLPKSAGDVIQVVSDRDGSTVIWLRDSNGTLRNVIVPAVGGVVVKRE